MLPFQGDQGAKVEPVYRVFFTAFLFLFASGIFFPFPVARLVSSLLCFIENETTLHVSFSRATGDPSFVP